MCVCVCVCKRSMTADISLVKSRMSSSHPSCIRRLLGAVGHYRGQRNTTPSLTFLSTFLVVLPSRLLFHTVCSMAQRQTALIDMMTFCACVCVCASWFCLAQIKQHRRLSSEQVYQDTEPPGLPSSIKTGHLTWGWCWFKIPSATHKSYLSQHRVVETNDYKEKEAWWKKRDAKMNTQTQVHTNPHTHARAHTHAHTRTCTHLYRTHTFYKKKKKKNWKNTKIKTDSKTTTVQIINNNYTVVSKWYII